MNDVQLRIAGLRKQAGLSQGAVRTGGEVGRNDDVHFRILVKNVIAKQKPLLHCRTKLRFWISRV